MSYSYTASAASSSRDPHDWGRAMASAMTSLAEEADAGGDPAHEALYGQDLHLSITPTEEGVLITLGWTPSSSGGQQA